MSGRGRPKKGETARENPGHKGPGSAQRKSTKKVRAKSGGNAEVDTPPEEKKKAESKAKRAAQPSGTRVSSSPCVRAEDTLPHTSVEDKKVRTPPKRVYSTDADPNKILQETLEKLTIRKKQRCEATQCVNEIQDAVKKHVEQSLSWCRGIQVLRTGSHYENLKICESDEFDVMFAVSVERVDIQPFGEDGAFYSVAMKRHPTHPLDRFLNEDKTLRSSEMLKEFREKVKEAAAKLSCDVSVEKKKQGCPAVTLQVKKNGTLISLDFVLGLEVHSSSWPTFTTDGFKVDKWLGKKVKRDLKLKPYYLVAKFEGRGTKEHEGVFAKDAWRISFSHVEKAILKDHGQSKICCQDQHICCRKQCLKLLKYLLKKLKEKYPREAKNLCSYHAKTTLLHACASRVEDSEWEANQLSHCFQQLLQDFEEHLKNYQLSNFFIPSHNLLKSAGLDKKRCDAVAKYIEYERNNCFPLFR